MRNTSGCAIKNYESSDRPRCGVPILFPSCGKPDGGVHHFNGSDYPIEVHGFADLLPWQVKTAADDEIVLTLTPQRPDQVCLPL